MGLTEELKSARDQADEVKALDAAKAHADEYTPDGPLSRITSKQGFMAGYDFGVKLTSAKIAEMEKIIETYASAENQFSGTIAEMEKKNSSTLETLKDIYFKRLVFPDLVLKDLIKSLGGEV